MRRKDAAVAEELRHRPLSIRQVIDSPNGAEDLAWKTAILDLYVKTMSVMTRLGIWLALVFLLQLALVAGVAYLIWRTL
jgi:hypothetical protein